MPSDNIPVLPLREGSTPSTVFSHERWLCSRWSNCRGHNPRQPRQQILRAALKCTIMHHFQSLPRDAMRKRGLCRHAVYVSVCPSRSWIVRVKTNKHIFKIFSPSGSQAILVFLYQTARQYSDGTPPPLMGASNTGGVGRNFDAEPISGFTA